MYYILFSESRSVVSHIIVTTALLYHFSILLLPDSSTVTTSVSASVHRHHCIAIGIESLAIPRSANLETFNSLLQTPPLLSSLLNHPLRHQDSRQLTLPTQKYHISPSKRRGPERVSRVTGASRSTPTIGHTCRPAVCLEIARFLKASRLNKPILYFRLRPGHGMVLTGHGVARPR